MTHEPSAAMVEAAARALLTVMRGGATDYAREALRAAFAVGAVEDKGVSPTEAGPTVSGGGRVRRDGGGKG
jgi:hypothetical protein